MHGPLCTTAWQAHDHTEKELFAIFITRDCTCKGKRQTNKAIKKAPEQEGGGIPLLPADHRNLIENFYFFLPV